MVLKQRNKFGHNIRSHDRSYISSYIKIMNVFGIFRALLNSLFDHLIEFNANISCKHIEIEFEPKSIKKKKKKKKKKHRLRWYCFHFGVRPKMLKECNLLILKANYGTYIDLRLVA